MKLLTQFALALSFCLLPGLCYGVEVCGELENSADWVKKNSPYIVTNDLYIPFKSRLKIEPGVEVIFTEPRQCKSNTIQFDWADSQYVSIKVDGALYLDGSEEDPIVFSGIKKGKTVSWDGIRIENKSSALVEIKHSIFQNAHNAIHAVNSNFPVRNCLFQYNNHGIYLDNGGNLQIINNNFVENRSSGIFINGSSPIVINNIFYKNMNYGIWSDSRQNLEINYNGFWENADGNCHRCENGMLIAVTQNARGDSADANYNIQMDPVFQGSKSFAEHQKKDLKVATPMESVADKKMALMEKEAIHKRGEKVAVFQNFGKGPYVLSKYSPYRGAGHPKEVFNNRDGTPNDIGMFGGPVETNGP